MGEYKSSFVDKPPLSLRKKSKAGGGSATEWTTATPLTHPAGSDIPPLFHDWLVKYGVLPAVAELLV